MRFLLLVAIGGLTLGQAPDPVFEQRDFHTRRLVQRLFGTHSRLNSIRQHYEKLQFANSLLLHDCGNQIDLAKSWCKQMKFSLDEVLKRSPAPGLTELDAKAKIDQKVGGDPNLVPGRGDYELISVVNRVDMATRTSNGAWVGAEIRFVYGLIESTNREPLDNEIIVEFVHGPMPWKDFRQLAQLWADLSATSLEDASFEGKLKSLVDAHDKNGYAKVRLRASLRVGGQSGWDFLEWELNAAEGMKFQRLADQIYEECNLNLPSERCRELKDLWKGVENAPVERRGTVPFPSSLQPEMERSFGTEGQAMFMPRNSCDATEGARNVIALRQCTMCHGPETKTKFVHVATRQRGARKASLSKFLTGPTESKASIAQLASGNANVAHEVILQYVAYGANGQGECNEMQIRTTTRRFNDLARRGLFLAEVLARDENSPPSEADAKFILRHGPQFGH